MSATPERAFINDHALAALVENHRRFLRFVERRVGDRQAAEDILQAAFAKGIEKAAAIRNDESVIPWFYRLLRNAITDHFRHAAAERRALEHHAVAAGDEEPDHDPEVEQAVCQCVLDLIDTLPPAYTDVLRRIDLDGASVSETARRLGATANTVRVRLHRARRALGRQLTLSCRTCAEHGCFDCSCQTTTGPQRSQRAQR